MNAGRSSLKKSTVGSSSKSTVGSSSKTTVPPRTSQRMSQQISQVSPPLRVHGIINTEMELIEVYSSLFRASRRLSRLDIFSPQNYFVVSFFLDPKASREYVYTCSGFYTNNLPLVFDMINKFGSVRFETLILDHENQSLNKKMEKDGDTLDPELLPQIDSEGRVTDKNLSESTKTHRPVNAVLKDIRDSELSPNVQLWLKERPLNKSKLKERLSQGSWPKRWVEEKRTILETVEENIEVKEEKKVESPIKTQSRKKVVEVKAKEKREEKGKEKEKNNPFDYIDQGECGSSMFTKGSEGEEFSDCSDNDFSLDDLDFYLGSNKIDQGTPPDNYEL